jgi:metal-responsive CopG/Arc/MetJ family transcriptional regulator
MRWDVTLPEDLIAQVEAVSREEGVTTDEIVHRAVKSFLFLRRFRELSGRMIKDLERRGITLTDEDVFEMVSEGTTLTSEWVRRG